MAESAVPQALAGLQISKTKELKGTEKRDSLIAQERRFQQAWEQEKVFEANAPTTTEIPLHSISAAELRNKTPKWTGTIAYPYMNGVLHVGHGFSFSKVEFTAGFARMRGKRVLWPQGFHCTGLPIKACADKLVEEVKMFGQEFERYKEEEPVAEAVVQATAPAAKGAKEDVTKFSSHKGKAGAKTIKAKYQFQIMKSMGIPVQEIHRFADASYWLEFFPPLCKTHLTNLGCRIDWRRSMVTTDANPYYDAFVRWQMTRLKELGKIRYGKRYTIYSAKDGQPCMDHDRSEGEALGPQEYTALKLKVVEYAPGFAKAIEGKIPEGASVYLVPATLRPETMYGQTCCFVGPKLDYGVFKGKKDNEYFLMTPRAAKNLAFQSGLSEAEDMKIPKQLAAVVGADMIGTLVNAPLSVHKQVRVLPMDTVLATKGTGVVTCVASDSPDDYATVADLRKKADYYKIKAEWAELEIVPIIDTPAYGNLTAEFLVKKLKISSPKDVKPLAEAKEAAYKEGFYNGTMLVGSCKGKKVQEAKDIIKKELFDSGDAFAYAEPEGRVVSRSGDECIVALLNQWFLTYGEEDWKQQALEFVENKDGKGLNTYIPETQNAFVGVLNWLYQWACGRTYGLGTRMPFDENVLVESLSDSTIYMSYYTIAHFLHSDNFGKQKGTGNIEPEQMTNEIWDYVFCRRELDDEIIKASRISRETLESMRREFEYFYPLDLRASGKDLIPNHLTFFIYNHIALFPREYWPVSIRTNGHLMLNGEKMSKSTGNFMTLNESISKFGSDATRMAFADAGDGIGDANFDEDVADATILNLFTKREVMAELAKDQDQLRTGELNSYPDKLFRNEMHTLVREAERHYEDTNYKLAIQSAWFLFGSIFSFYKEACAATGIKLHKDLIMEYIELHALIMTPITPHWSEYIWLDILKKPQSIQHALWPQVPEADPGLTAAYNYAKGTSSNINSAEGQFLRKLGKGKATSFDPKKPKKLTVFVASKFPSWQEKYIDVLKRHWDASASSVRDEKALMAEVGAFKELKKAAPFVNQLKKRLQGGEDAGTVLERKLAFDESALLLDMVPSLKRVAGFHTVTIVSVEEGSKAGKDLTDGGKEVEVTSQTAENAVPGIPTFNFENVEA